MSMSNLSPEEIQKLIPGYVPIRSEKEQKALDKSYEQIKSANLLQTGQEYQVKHFSTSTKFVEILHVKYVATYNNEIYLVDENKPLNLNKQNQYTNEIESDANLAKREISSLQTFAGKEPDKSTYNLKIRIDQFNTEPFDPTNKNDIYSFFKREQTFLGTAYTMGLNVLGRVGGNRKTSSKKYKKATKKQKINKKHKNHKKTSTTKKTT
jgi:hypothetical protein